MGSLYFYTKLQTWLSLCAIMISSFDSAVLGLHNLLNTKRRLLLQFIKNHYFKWK